MCVFLFHHLRHDKCVYKSLAGELKSLKKHKTVQENKKKEKNSLCLLRHIFLYIFFFRGLRQSLSCFHFISIHPLFFLTCLTPSYSLKLLT